MSLPINRSSKATLDANLVNGNTSDAPAIKNSNDVVYNTIDELYNYALNLVNAGSLTTYPPGDYNKFINGNFDVWQRGTIQITSPSGAYFPDRISIANSATNASAIKIDQGSSSPPIGSKYYLRYRLSTASATTVSASRLFRYKMESIDVQKLIGNQVTVSFQIKSSVSRNFSYSLNVNGFTGVDNGINGTGLITGDADYAGNVVALTANTWTTVSKTFSMQDPTIGTGLASNGISIELWGRYTTSEAETDTEYQFSQIQLVTGSDALPFQPRDYPDELLRCLRYYQKSYSYATLPGTVVDAGAPIWLQGAVSTGYHSGNVQLQSPMRTSSYTILYWDRAGNTSKITTLDSSAVPTQNVTPTAGPGEVTEKGFRVAHSGTIAGISFHYALDDEL